MVDEAEVMGPLIGFVDTETTGLDPDRHEVWEVALVLYDPHARRVVSEHVWQLPVNLGVADPIALRIGGFRDRRWKNALLDGSSPVVVGGGCHDQEDYQRVLSLAGVRMWAETFVQLTDGVHLAGAVVSFDEERLRRLIRRVGECPGWHYHLIDVEALAVGALAGGDPPFTVMLPWNSDALSDALGVSVTAEDRHTALGDARWAMRLYEAVTR